MDARLPMPLPTLRAKKLSKLREKQRSRPKGYCQLFPASNVRLSFVEEQAASSGIMENADYHNRPTSASAIYRSPKPYWLEYKADSTLVPKVEIKGLPQGWSLDIPDGALSEDITVICKVHTSNDNLLGPYDKLASEIVEMEPKGFEFVHPVTLTIPLKVEPRDGQCIVVMTSQDGIKWTELTNPVDLINGNYNISIFHFTLFALLICYVKVSRVIDGKKEEFLASTKDNKVGLLVPEGALLQPTTITMHVLKIDQLLAHEDIYAEDIVHIYAGDYSFDQTIKEFHKTTKLTLRFPRPECPNGSGMIFKILKECNNEWTCFETENNTKFSTDRYYVSFDIKSHGCYTVVVQKEPCNISTVLKRIFDDIRFTPANIFLLQRVEDWKKLLVICISQKKYDKYVKDMISKDIYTKNKDPPSATYLQEGQKVYFKLSNASIFKPFEMDHIIFHENFNHCNGRIQLKFKEHFENTKNNDEQYLVAYSSRNYEQDIPEPCRFKLFLAIEQPSANPEYTSPIEKQNGETSYRPNIQIEHSTSFTKIPPNLYNCESNMSTNTATIALLVNDEWGTSKGGISTINRQIGGQVLRDQFKVYCMVVKADQADIDDAERHCVTLIQPKQLDLSTDGKLDCLPLWQAYFQDILKKILKSEEVKIVIGHADVTHSAALNIKKELYPSAKYITFFHVIPEDCECLKDSKPTAMKEKEKNLQQHADDSSVDCIVSVGPRIYNHFVDRHRNKHHLQYIPFPEPKFYERNVCPPIGQKRILTFGRVNKVWRLKGYDLLARAIGKAVESYTKVHSNEEPPVWIVCGVPDEDVKNTETFLRKCSKFGKLEIKIWPYISHDEIISQMKSCCLCLMGSRSEPFGLVGLEAIAMGVPVLINRSSGLAKLIIDHFPQFRQCILDVCYDSADIDQNYHTFNDVATKWEEKILEKINYLEAAFDEAGKFKQAFIESKQTGGVIKNKTKEFLSFCFQEN